jgi:uncharacterized protein (TIGR03066 family)
MPASIMRIIGSRSLLVCILIGAAGAVRLQAQEKKALKDYSGIKLEEFGIKPVEPKKDAKTGFLVGGKNSTADIETLTEINGKNIAKLEKVMRPGALSEAGFLGKDENLLKVLAADNKYVVDELGLTHQELARHLHALGAVWRRQARNKESDAFLYHGRKFKVDGIATFGFQPSPFEDGTKEGSNVTVHNLDNGKKLKYALLVPYMVERYGFYEGKGTPYRVSPSDIVAVFDFLARKAGPIDASRLIGVWELTDVAGETPPDWRIEFGKDGKLRMSSKRDGKEFKVEGTHVLTKDKLTITVVMDGKTVDSNTVTILKLTDDVLVFVDSGKKMTFRRGK